MKTSKITDKDIDTILNDKLTVRHWELQLGIGLRYEYVEKNVKFSAPYPEMGKEFWKVCKYELYKILCNKGKKSPKEWLGDYITGDIRNLVVAICSSITSKYDISLGIAIPLTALIIKKGITHFCKNAPSKKPEKTVKQILELRKVHSRKNNKMLQ